MTYRITIRTLTGALLTFKGVTEYSVVDGYLTFQDPKTQLPKRFAVANSEIEQEVIQ